MDENRGPNIVSGLSEFKQFVQNMRFGERDSYVLNDPLKNDLEERGIDEDSFLEVFSVCEGLKEILNHPFLEKVLLLGKDVEARLNQKCIDLQKMNCRSAATHFKGKDRKGFDNIPDSVRIIYNQFPDHQETYLNSIDLISVDRLADGYEISLSRGIEKSLKLYWKRIKTQIGEEKALDYLKEIEEIIGGGGYGNN